MNNLRFSTAVHILVLLDKYRGELMTSEVIAGSINVNPVVVRREIKALREAGYILARKGKEGGCALAIDPDKIRLGDLYKLVNKETILGRKNHPNPNCPIGCQMNKNLEVLYTQTDKEMTDMLNKQTLKDFSNRFD